MLRTLTSLTFLYAFAIGVLLIYAAIFYRDFTRSRYQRRRFPVVFLLLSLACFGFLWVNLNAPLKLQTYSNLDHQFIQQDGFLVAGQIELGGADTGQSASNSFNRFVFSRQGDAVNVKSVYSEEPLYIQNGNRFKIATVSYPATGHAIHLMLDGQKVSISASSDDEFVLTLGESRIVKQQSLRRGSSVWNLFRDEDEFIHHRLYNHPVLVAALKQIFLLRDDVAKRSAGDLKFFLSGRLFRFIRQVNYDQQAIQLESLSFSSVLSDNGLIAWGLGFLDNNRNQYRIQYAGKDSFYLLHRYPVSYPLTEEHRQNWEPQTVTKFLVSDGKDIQRIPAVFQEGFLFPFFDQDKETAFAPVLLNYQKAEADQPLQLSARWLDQRTGNIAMKDNLIFLPAKQPGFKWMFSVRNTYHWEFSGFTLSASAWKGLLFGSLGFFCLLVLASSFLQPVNRQSWIWQLLSGITLVLLTTRFFLYWRYKSFPPYEGMDLPSQQQLQSFSNFGIILLAAVLLGIFFGFTALRRSVLQLRKGIEKGLNRSRTLSGPTKGPDLDMIWKKAESTFPFLQRVNKKLLFFGSWLLLLMASGAVAAIYRFDPGVCRHIAIAFVLIYFIYLFISYRFSPLVASSSAAWWRLGTGRQLDILVSNPVKILLSVSLLGLLVFIDIGFAIVFLNFLLFNEAFLCINYGIAGLSAGSKRNAGLFGFIGLTYLLLFVLNLLYAPYIFKFLLELPQPLYLVAYLLFGISLAYVILRIQPQLNARKRRFIALGMVTGLFALAFFFFPKEKILEKASMTKYRIDVLTTPVEKAIAQAYEEGKTYEPVIRAAQNQWFINTFIYEGNNPAVQSPGFSLLAHAPQNKGAKYNAQATDLVASRFLMGEHGKWAVLLYVLLLIIPISLLATFYKLYPDFTNRINNNYPGLTAGFSVLNYLLITALLVILAATGRYIFFGQDLPFGSILSKQSILFPALLLIAAVLFFQRIPLEHYGNRKKLLPGLIVFTLLTVLLFLVKPIFNKNKEFGVAELAMQMDDYVQENLQPLMNHFDTSSRTRRLTLASKDQLFTDSLRKMLDAGFFVTENKFFSRELTAYVRSGYSRHLDQRRMLYLDPSSGSPQLAVNNNYFRVEAPPHLQQLWTGNVLGDTSIYNVSLWDAKDQRLYSLRANAFGQQDTYLTEGKLQLGYRIKGDVAGLYLFNRSASPVNLVLSGQRINLAKNDSLQLNNPFRARLIDPATGEESVLDVQPDAYMRNYYVNGSRYYVYPMGSHFIWARNFAEAISSDYTNNGQNSRNAIVSLDYPIMDSLLGKIRAMMERDGEYKDGAEYGISIADGNGRIIALADYIKGFNRPDPNDKAGFLRAMSGEDGYISQTVLRKLIGNINLLRLNPGPGSTLKPIVFSAIASQLPMEWDQFESRGFTGKQESFGGAKVAEYDFEKDNGVINNVTNYLKYSDNYYHANVLLLGSYSKQSLSLLLSDHFQSGGAAGISNAWPYFHYKGMRYSLNSFKHWPGYINGKADFHSENSFVTTGLLDNFHIYTKTQSRSFDMYPSRYDSLLFQDAWRRSGFILPENGLFDQEAAQVDHRIPYDLFATGFRGHVKGSSQVRIPPAIMMEAMGKLSSQNRNYALTMDPYAVTPGFMPFQVDQQIIYNNYLSLIREDVMTGMREVLFNGTAARLGSQLKNGAPYYYYGKTGTTGDDELKSKSKLFSLIISSKDITHPGFNFRNNPFFTIYFTSQNGPAKQNEEFQAEIIRYLESTDLFRNYMKGLK